MRQHVPHYKDSALMSELKPAERVLRLGGGDAFFGLLLSELKPAERVLRQTALKQESRKTHVGIKTRREGIETL